MKQIYVDDDTICYAENMVCMRVVNGGASSCVECHFGKDIKFVIAIGEYGRMREVFNRVQNRLLDNKPIYMRQIINSVEKCFS
jgi:hypothetical protein